MEAEEAAARAAQTVRDMQMAEALPARASEPTMAVDKFVFFDLGLLGISPFGVFSKSPAPSGEIPRNPTCADGFLGGRRPF